MSAASFHFPAPRTGGLPARRIFCVLQMILPMALLVLATAGCQRSTKQGTANPDVSTRTATNESPRASAPASPAPVSTPLPANVENPPSSPPASTLREAFPHIRVDTERKLVEFDAEVPHYAYATEEGLIFLETVVCTRDTREHETMLVTDARPSLVHAALLMIGLEPGAPGGWKWNAATKDQAAAIEPLSPKGPRVRVTFVFERDGKRAEEPATTWARNNKTKQLWSESLTPGDGFVFAGSVMRSDRPHLPYEADGAGTLVGLTTFGGETIAWSRLYSPEAEVEEPVWVVARDRTPTEGTKVVVRVTAE